MADDAKRVRALADGVTDDKARRKPDPDSWSILEVVNHQRDVEQEDFRVFLDLTLHWPTDRRRGGGRVSRISSAHQRSSFIATRSWSERSRTK